MESAPFKTRLAQLIHRSKRAVRAYASLERGNAKGWAEIQAVEWRKINVDLMNELAIIMQNKQVTAMVRAVSTLRDKFLQNFRDLEIELNKKNRELIKASEAADFVRSAILATELVSIRARKQSKEAAYNELRAIIKNHEFGEDELNVPETSKGFLMGESFELKSKENATVYLDKRGIASRLNALLSDTPRKNSTRTVSDQGYRFNRGASISTPITLDSSSTIHSAHSTATHTAKVIPLKRSNKRG